MQTHAFSVADNLEQLVLPMAILFGVGLRDNNGRKSDVG
jgi:hypothetical protein